MANIDILPLIVKLNVPDGAYTLKISVDEAFFATNGTQISGAVSGVFNAPALVSGGICQTELITIAATTDALDNQFVRYREAAIYKKNKLVHSILEDFVVPSDFSPQTTFAQLAIRNKSFLQFVERTGYTKQQVDALIYSAIDGIALNKAATTAHGITKLDILPATVGDPIAVGVNSPRVSYVLSAISPTSDVVGVCNALSGIYARSTLVIKDRPTITENYTTPANVELEFEGDGMLNAANGRIVNVTTMKNPGNKKVFGGGGNIYFANNSNLNEFNIYWWAGKDTDSADHTKAFEQAIGSLINRGGGVFRIPFGIWKTEGGHLLPSFASIEGDGANADGLYATTIKLIESAHDYIFKVGDYFQHINVSRLQLDCANRKETTCFLAEGSYPNSGRFLHFDRVCFSFAERGFWFKDADDNGTWEVQNLSFFKPIFIGCKRGIQSDSPNTAITIGCPQFFIPEQGYGLYLNAVAAFVCDNYMALGYQSVPYGFNWCDRIPPGDGSDLTTDPLAHCFAYIGANHGNINFTNGIDEALKFFMIYDGFTRNPVNLRGNAVQSAILLRSPNGNIVLESNYLPSNSVQDIAGAGCRVTDTDNTVSLTDLCTGNVLPAPKLTSFQGESIVLYSRNLLLGETNRMPIRQLYDDLFFGSALPMHEILSFDTNQILLRLGSCDANENFGAGYTFSRDANGHLNILSTQTGVGQDIYRRIKTNGEIELTTNGQGVYMRSPNGTRYKLTISNAGAVVVIAAP